MEEQLVHILAQTQVAQEGPRKAAEQYLREQSANDDFPLALVSIGSRPDLPLQVRQAALLYLKTFVLARWSEAFDEFDDRPYTDGAKKAQIRQALLELALSGRNERKIESAAGLVLTKIALADFPDEWPELFPVVIQAVVSDDDARIHGALKVLAELVDECLNEEQFFKLARDLINVLYGVATNDSRRLTSRALAISVFRSCFDTLEMVMESHKAAVQSFAQETVSGWIPFIFAVLNQQLPPMPAEDEPAESASSIVYRGSISLKIQVNKVLMRIRTLFPSTIASQSVALFTATWQELSTLQSQYQALYIDDDRQGRLEDADGLPYTIDLLVLEELDFLQACLRASPVKKELSAQLKAASSAESSWLTQVMQLVVAYSQITVEEEGLWDYDINAFVSEEDSLTANYTSRTACGDLVTKLGDWRCKETVQSLLAYLRVVCSNNSASWKVKEAGLYLFDQVTSHDDYDTNPPVLSQSQTTEILDILTHIIQDEEALLRARGLLLAGGVFHCQKDSVHTPGFRDFLGATANALTQDPSAIVRAASVKTLRHYVPELDATDVNHELQEAITNALAVFLTTPEMEEVGEGDDLLLSVVDTLRGVLQLGPEKALAGNGIDLLLTIASRGAANFQIAQLVSETFDDVTIDCKNVSLFDKLWAKVMPWLTSSLDVADLSDAMNETATLAADILAVILDNAVSPLPRTFVATILPRIVRVVLEGQDDELLKSATDSLRHILKKDPEQVFEYRNDQGQSGLELTLRVIEKLLDPSTHDHGASEVGALAVELVRKVGRERLGTYMSQLLQAIAIRVATAEHANFIQSLILVFARIAKDADAARLVVDFLAQVQVGENSGLGVVLAKWLENSINFSGYKDIQANVNALTHIYSLQDPRIAAIQVKGDLIVRPEQSGRIMTRSRARQQPDQYTTVSAQLKIVKVLVEELIDPASQNGALTAAQAAAKAADASDSADEDDDLKPSEMGSDDGWEDEPIGRDFLDLAGGMSKAELMAFAEGDALENARVGNDNDRVQKRLIQWFRAQGQQGGFEQVFSQLTGEEQEKLRRLVA